MSSVQVLEQFSELLASIRLPGAWRKAIAERCSAPTNDESGERVHARRAELETEQKRLVTAFAKGYLSETDLDVHVERIRAELQRLPPVSRSANVEAFIDTAVAAGETLTDMAGYWREALPEERRDIVWAILLADGLIYDLERRVIAGMLPRPDVLPVLALGLEADWEQRNGGLWSRATDAMPKVARVKRLPPPTPPALTPEQRAEALALLRSGLSLRKVAAKFPGVSYGAMWRLLQAQQHAGEVTTGEDGEGE